ncbi:hypothetical protein D3C72_2287900 [compost metagenome]
MPLETTKFDIHDVLKTPEDRAVYIEAALEDGDVSLITHVRPMTITTFQLN